MNLDILLDQLDLEAKVRLLTGATFFTLHEEPAVGLAAMAFSDGPTGVRGVEFSEGPRASLLPNATLLAAAWSEEVAHEVGALLAEEAERQHIHVVLGPHHQPAPIPARRSALRGLLRGPAAHRPAGRGVRPGSAGTRHRRVPQAPGRQRGRDRAAHREQRRRRPHAARALPAAVRDRRPGRRPVVGDGGVQRRERGAGHRAGRRQQRDPQGRSGAGRPAHVRLVRHEVRRAGRQRRARPGDAGARRAVGRGSGRGGRERRGRRSRSSTTTYAACCCSRSGSARSANPGPGPTTGRNPTTRCVASSCCGSAASGMTVLTNDGTLPLATDTSRRPDRPARAGDDLHGRRLGAGARATPGQRRRGPAVAAGRGGHRRRRGRRTHPTAVGAPRSRHRPGHRRRRHPGQGLRRGGDADA